MAPPCGLDYGTQDDEANIIAQMRYGSVADAINAINQAKNSRGTALGCPQSAVSYATPDFTEPALSEIVTIWNTVHAPAISSFSVTCPRIGRYENNSALGAYYAMQAGYFSDTATLSMIADMMYDQQYASWNIASPDPRNEGVFAYVNVPETDPCYLGGVVGAGVSKICASLPQYCVIYTDGQFAGSTFATADQDDDANWFDGGLAYDHGWAGVQMIESSLLQSRPSSKLKYRNSALLAGKFALSEYPVKNHNYTSKLIWLLAELYALTGDGMYRDELNLKLDKNLIPGILWDGDNDGFVDGTSPPVAFSDLTSTAQIPGRMWDGHNSLPWYHAMNAWAMTEAYVAFRDRGDTQRAAQLKPYAIAMLDNLAREIINHGVVTPDQLGVRDITYALLIGIWKIVQYENEAHPDWEKAAWAMWNTGYFDTYSTHSVCMGLYLLVRSHTGYTPLATRDDLVLGLRHENDFDENFIIFPNPSRDKVTIKCPKPIASEQACLRIYNLHGQLMIVKKLNPGNNEISLKNLNNGVYIFEFSLGKGRKLRQKFVKSN